MSKPRYRVTIDVFYSQEDEGWIAAIAYPDGSHSLNAFGDTPEEAMFHLGRVLQLAFDPGDNDVDIRGYAEIMEVTE